MQFNVTYALILAVELIENTDGCELWLTGFIYPKSRGEPLFFGSLFADDGMAKGNHPCWSHRDYMAGLPSEVRSIGANKANNRKNIC